MTDFAAWTPDGAQDGAGSAQEAPGAASWLPPGVLRRQALEDVAEAKQARAEARGREARAQGAQDRALGAYIEGAALRGEDVTALDIINGTVGRTWEQITAGEGAELADRIPKEHREPLNFVDAPVRRAQMHRDPDGVIGRAQLAAEARRLDRRGEDAARVLEELRARRGPGRLEDAWAAWRWR